jgi:hypothetical protein
MDQTLSPELVRGVNSKEVVSRIKRDGSSQCIGNIMWSLSKGRHACRLADEVDDAQSADKFIKGASPQNVAMALWSLATMKNNNDLPYDPNHNNTPIHHWKTRSKVREAILPLCSPILRCANLTRSRSFSRFRSSQFGHAFVERVGEKDVVEEYVQDCLPRDVSMLVWALGVLKSSSSLLMLER